MPKVSSENNIHVVTPGMTLVRSRAYGLHLRASRGTHKKARLNPILKKAAAFIAEANESMDTSSRKRMFRVPRRDCGWLRRGG